MTEYVTSARGDRVGLDHRGEGPALVFVSGAGPFRATDPVTTETAERAAALGVSTLVWDRLGRGDSPADGVLDLDRELAALAAVIERAGGRAVLCGHSSGCSIALRAAADGMPVAGLALWEAPLGPEGGEAAEWIAEFERLLDAGDLDGALAQYMKDMPPEWLEGARHDPEFPVHLSNVPSMRADGRSLVWAESAPLATLLAPVRVPVQAMVGEETFPGMVESAELVLAAVPGATLRRMPGADHSWEPEAMAAELARFTREAFEVA
ncbi:MAG: alpha/beta fold hydrolase [Phycicoccus sp.]